MVRYGQVFHGRSHCAGSSDAVRLRIREMPGSKLVPQIIAGLTVALAVGGCSPSSLFGNGKDDKVENTRSYRTINTNCASVNLSSSTLDLPTFKSLLNCLNSNGALKELVELTNAL